MPLLDSRLSHGDCLQNKDARTQSLRYPVGVEHTSKIVIEPDGWPVKITASPRQLVLWSRSWTSKWISDDLAKDLVTLGNPCCFSLVTSNLEGEKVKDCDNKSDGCKEGNG